MELTLIQKNVKNQINNKNFNLKLNEKTIGNILLPEWFGTEPSDYIYLLYTIQDEIDVRNIDKVKAYFKDGTNHTFKEEDWNCNEPYKTSGYFYLDETNPEKKEEFITVDEGEGSLIKTIGKNYITYEFTIKYEDGESQRAFSLIFANDEFDSVVFLNKNKYWRVDKNGDCSCWTNKFKKHYKISEEDLNNFIFELEDVKTIPQAKKAVVNFLSDVILFQDTRSEEEILITTMLNLNKPLKIDHEELLQYKNARKERDELLNSNCPLE